MLYSEKETENDLDRVSVLSFSPRGSSKKVVPWKLRDVMADDPKAAVKELEQKSNHQGPMKAKIQDTLGDPQNSG